MKETSFFKSLLKGIVISTIALLFMLVLLSIIMTKFDLTEKVYNIVYIVLTTLALVIGAVLSAKCNGRKGWLIGLFSGVIFYIVTYFLGGLVNGEFDFSTVQLYKIIGSAIIGTISGMLGVNL